MFNTQPSRKERKKVNERQFAKEKREREREINGNKGKCNTEEKEKPAWLLHKPDRILARVQQSHPNVAPIYNPAIIIINANSH